jgi:hypothetical protein
LTLLFFDEELLDFLSMSVFGVVGTAGCISVSMGTFSSSEETSETIFDFLFDLKDFLE